MATTTGTAASEEAAAEEGRRAGLRPALGRRRTGRGRMGRTVTVAAVLFGSGALWLGCSNSGSSAAPPVPTEPGGGVDPALATGREVWTGRCSRCHGGDGGGGAGPRINDGRLLRDFPDPAEQAEVIRKGRKGMPSFDDKLSDAEIQAVVRYTREVLGTS